MMSTGIEEIGDLEPVTLNVAINQIIARKQIYPEMQVFVRGDRRVDFEKVINVVARLKEFDILDKVGFMTENLN